MKNMLLRFFLLIFFCITGLFLGLRAQTIYVNPTLDKYAAEPSAKVVKTLEEAVKLLKNKKFSVVVLSDGIHRIGNTIELTAKNTSGIPVLFKSENLHGAIIKHERQLAYSDFKPISDRKILDRIEPELRGSVKELDLKKLGIKVPDFGDAFRFIQNFPELFLDDERLPLSRYPNEGYMTMKKVVDNFGNENRGGTFEYREDRHEKWKNAVEEGLWFTGFWRIPWQAHTVKIKDIDTDKRTVTILKGWDVSKNPANNGIFNGIGSKYDRPYGSGKEPYYVTNLLEELDIPGEWCVDFKRQKLYVYISDTFEKGSITMTYGEDPIFRLKGVSCVTLEGVVLSNGRGNGIEIYDGKNNSVLGCVIKNIGQTAVVIDGGFNHTIKSCDMELLGSGGVLVSGGNRAELIPSNHLIENCHIHNYGLIKDSWAAGIQMGKYDAGGSDYGADEGVGITARHNLINDAPHSAFLYGGNQQIIEYNEIFDIAKLTGDVGALYSRWDWTSRGNVVRHNFIHHIPRANGTYHDDGHAGDSVYCNIIHNAIDGTLIGGGHDNIVKDNIYIDCIKAAIRLDARGQSRNYNKGNDKFMFRFREYAIGKGLWEKNFPEMKYFLDREHLELPNENIIGNNIMINNKDKSFHPAGDEADFRFSKIEPNITIEYAPADLIDRLIDERDEGIINCFGVQTPNVNLKNIGLYTDEYRKSLPDIRQMVNKINKSEMGFDSSKDVDATNKE